MMQYSERSHLVLVLFVVGAVGSTSWLSACTGRVGDASTGPHAAPASAQRPTAPGPMPGQPVPTVLVRRLSRAELDRTLADVLGDETAPALRLLVEDEYGPYDNDYTLQRASQAYTDALREFASDVAQRVISTPTTRSEFMPCEPSGPDDSGCFRRAIEKLGLRLLRRPLSAAEVERYLSLHTFAVQNTPAPSNSFWTGLELLLRALLMDPEFLHRVQAARPTTTPSVHALDSYEIATRMALLVWGSAPDEQLLAAAASDSLLSPQGRAIELERMLDSSRARSQVHRFHAMWLGYRALPHPPETTALFAAETTKLLDKVVFDGAGSYFELFTSDRSYMARELARHYGLPEPPTSAGWVQYGNSGRGGILSHGSVLAAFSKFSDTSPTQRGIFVRTRLLCEKMAPPPANVDVDQPPGDVDAECKTDRYLAHMGQPGCLSCHRLVDPIGMGLENYDIGGRWRDSDDGKPHCAIPGQGQIEAIGAFSGPKQLAELLLGAGEIQDCVVRQLLSFALGRELERADEPLVSELKAAMAREQDRFVGLLRGLVTSGSFAFRRVPEVMP